MAPEPAEEETLGHLARWIPRASLGAAFLHFLAGIGAVPYWLDSPEFTAAAVDLDLAHPPGHPLAALWGALFTWLPVGSLSFRVSLGQAAAGVLALWSVQRALDRLLRRLGISAGPMRALLVASAVLSLAVSPALHFQAIRAEVYALQAALICFAVERAAAQVDMPAAPPSGLYLGSFALGLGLANHHLIAFLAGPALVWPLVQQTRRRGWIVLGWAVASAAAGLSTYAYLPLRAAARPPMDLGHPVDWAAFLWVVSARVYSHSMGTDAPQPMSERAMDMVLLLMENLSVWTLFAAVLGTYVLLRHAHVRALACTWCIAAAVNLSARVWLGSVRSNPDILGYILPGLAALQVLAWGGIGALISALPSGRAARTFALSIALVLFAYSATSMARPRADGDLASFLATSQVHDFAYRDLPAGAVLILTTPQSAFLHWGSEAVERARPDVVMVPLPFLSYGARGRLLANSEPDVAPFVSSYLRHQTITRDALRELAARRAVFVEADEKLTGALSDLLVPTDHLFYRLSLQPQSLDTLQAVHGRRRSAQSQLVAQLGVALNDAETRNHLLWTYYVDALFFRARSLPREALDCAQHALELAPKDRSVLALMRSLQP